MPRAAYLHVPFCRHRCGYCNFTLVAGRDDLMDAYLEALERELRQLGAPRAVETLFLGGGTPTHLPAQRLDRLLALAARWFPLAPGGEWSVEANPADLDPPRAAVLARHGVTRVSLGAQSFQPAKLATLERDHGPADIAAAARQARAMGASVSLDLIFGVPGESLAMWRDDLETALALAPDHLSTYGLTFERGTAFWSRQRRGDLAAVDEETERGMYELTLDRLAAAGWEHYEVSNFARPGHRCRHNERYWLGAEYYAAGPGAARYVAGRRETNHRSTTTYIRLMLAGDSPVAESEAIPAELAARERLVFGLRRLEGVDLEQIAAATGIDLRALVGHTLDRYAEWGLLQQRGPHWRLTRRGLLVSDSLWPDLLG